jgi:RNA polymerase sigma-70 factor (ECF subfamily)
MELDASVQETSDEELMARVASGDGDAFAAFYDRHCAILFGIACRILQNEADAQDALQEACLQLWDRAEAYNSNLGRPLSWAVTLVRNKAIDRLRSEVRRGAAHERAGVEGQTTEAATLPIPASGLDSDCGKLVREALIHLPSEQREALNLAFFTGLTHFELATEIGAPLGTVKARIRRGLLALRDALEGKL